MFYRAERFNPWRLGTQGIFRREFRIKLSVENFNVWKFPQICIHNAGGPLPDKKTPVSFSDKGNKVSSRDDFAFAKVWQLFDSIFPERDAEFFDRANQAPRITRRANQRTEFHQRLVEVRAIRVFGGARLCRAVTSF